MKRVLLNKLNIVAERLQNNIEHGVRTNYPESAMEKNFETIYGITHHEIERLYRILGNKNLIEECTIENSEKVDWAYERIINQA